MKNKILIFLALLIVPMASAVDVFYDTELTATTDAQEHILTFTVDNITNFSSMDLWFTYDTDVFNTPELIREGTLIEGFSFSINDSIEGEFRIACATGNFVSGEGDLVKFNFTSKQEGTSDIGISKLKLNGKYIEYRLNPTEPLEVYLTIQEEVNKYDTFEIIVNAERLEEVIGFEMELDYNQEALKIIEVTSQVFTDTDYRDNKVVGYFNSLDTFTGDGQLLNITLKALRDGEYTITPTAVLSYRNEEYETHIEDVGVEGKTIIITWKDKTTKENDGTENITETITLPDGSEINRTIEAGEILQYVEFETGEIIIPESNVIIDDIKKENNVLEIIATSSGERCFDIYSTTNPYEITINDVVVGFTYGNNLIHFCTNFSTKTIKVNYNFPPPTPPSTSSGSSSGRSHRYTHQDDIIKAPPKVEDKKEEIIDEPEPGIIEPEEKIVEEPKEPQWIILWITLGLIAAVSIVGYFLFIREPKKE